MRVYNLFVIKKEYYDFYQRKPELLFATLENLYNMEKCFNYGITLFEQLCHKISVETVKHYLNTKYNVHYDNIFPFKDFLIELHYSRIIIRSTYNFPGILKIFNCYSRTIFVCDFENKDYFFLDNFVKSKFLIGQ